jgi:Leucine-rich repeat (LRR) protein
MYCSRYLNNNNISWIVEDMSGAFYGLNHLRKLGLAANEITSINNKAFIGLDSLVHLDLSKNNIKAIQDNAFYGMHLEVLLVNTTSLLCDCALAWLPTWVETNSLELHNVYCAYPKPLQGKKFMSILSQNFLCCEF